MNQNILQQLIGKKGELPKKQQRLCDFLLENYQNLGVMTVSELAEQSEVGTTTVIRFMQGFGFDNFNSFKRAFHEITLQNTSYQQLKDSFAASECNTLKQVVHDGIQVLSQLETPSNLQGFEEALSLLRNAKRIFTFGKRSSKAMALHFEYAIHCFYPNIYQLSHEADYIFDRLGLVVTTEDVFVLFSVWPSTKETVSVAEFCYENKIPILLITNSHRNPNCHLAQVVINTASLNHESGAVATVAVIEALISEFGKRLAPNSRKNLENIERILGEQGIILS